MDHAIAKTKWCPFSSTITNGRPGINRLTDNTGSAYVVTDTRCLGDGCMLWLWDAGEHEGHCGLANRAE